jgi:hypothetical protein
MAMNSIRPEQSRKLNAAFNAGFSVRGAARYAGVDKKTGFRYFNQLSPMTCLCGRKLPHQFWCAWRVSMSEGRQNFLKAFARGNIKPATRHSWDQKRLQIMEILKSATLLLPMHQADLDDLRRFYDPAAPYAFEYSPASKWGRDTQITAVGVVMPTQENSSFALFAAMEQLHPAVQNMLHAIIDGASIDDAAIESGIGADELLTVMPRLKLFLAPYLDRSAAP